MPAQKIRDYATTGRVTVKAYRDVVVLGLAHWALKKDATLTPGEAREVVAQIEDALRELASPPDVERSSDGLEDLLG